MAISPWKDGTPLFADKGDLCKSARTLGRLVQARLHQEPASPDPNDLPAFFLMYLLDSGNLSWISNRVEAKPGFWSSALTWPNRYQPLWLPIFVDFLSKLPGFGHHLKSLEQSWTRGDSKKTYAGPFASKSSECLFHALAQDNRERVGQYAELLCETDAAEELTTAKGYGQASVATLMHEWSFRPLLLGVACGSGAVKPIMELVTVLERSLKNESNSLPFVQNLTGDPATSARWTLTQALCDMPPQWRDLFSVGLERACSRQFSHEAPAPKEMYGTLLREHQDQINGLLVSACARIETEVAFTKANNRTLMQTKDWCASRVGVEKNTETQSARQVVRKPEHTIKASYDPKSKLWHIVWEGVFEWSSLPAGGQQRALEVFFDALKTATWYSQHSKAKVELEFILQTHWPSSKASKVVKGAVKDTNRAFASSEEYAWTEEEKKEWKELSPPKTQKKELDKVRRMINRARKHLGVVAGDKRTKQELTNLITKSGLSLWTIVHPRMVEWTPTKPPW